MDATTLAHKMLEWGNLKAQLDTLTAEIEGAVLEIGETQTVGNVRASYSAGRKTFDYRAAADGHPMVDTATIALFTAMPDPKIDWRGICKHVGIPDVPFIQNEPSVMVKLLETEK